MRVPLSWLRAYCDPPLSAAAIGEVLNASGTELERIERIGVPATDGFVVARVLSARPHPDADRLRVCAVDDGAGDPRTVVCGAPNVAAGQTVALARPGAQLPDGSRLKEVKLRGIASSGMILAEDEIGLGDDHGGIMVLAGELAPGTPLREALPIQDDVLDLEVSPNRPDCLAVYGVARELHALTGAPLAADPTAGDAEHVGAGSAADHAAIEIEDPDMCLRFTARIFCDVEIGPSPLWLRARLHAAGQRSISNVVDITNYVMLLTGQPLHAFDLDAVRDRRIIVRRARQGERITTLDGVERALDPDIVLTADAAGPSGIAGIMGGQVSEVEATTTHVLMEAATWVGSNILRSSTKLGLRTEASTRFEKGLHPALAPAAQRLAARLMVELCGARLVPGTLDEYPRPASPRRVRLRTERVERLLGERIEADEIEETLTRLGFGADRADGGFDVAVPSFRDGDVQREADLIEEVARVHGVDRLPTRLPARRSAIGRLSPRLRLRRRLEDELRGRGLSEAISYSFTSPQALARLRLADVRVLRIANPLSEEHSVMRPLLLPGLLDAAAHNAAHGRTGLALFESARVYEPGEPQGVPADPTASPNGETPARERHHLGAIIGARPGTWRSPPVAGDFYAAKAIVTTLLGAARIGAWSVEPSSESFLHPGRQARVLAGGDKLGWIGELHPAIAAELGLGPLGCFELDADALTLLAPGAASFRDVTSYPAVLQDIAVIVSEDVPAAAVEACVRAAAGDLLDRLTLFDVYRGDQVGAGHKSVALRLEFRSPERTLTDDEVLAARGEIERELERIEGRLRA